MRNEPAFLAGMLESGRRILRAISGRTYDEFLLDEMLQDALLWRLSVIGEAAKKISDATRAALPQLPFDDMAAMRDFISHVYWRIDHKIVWETATRDVPDLVRHLSSRIGPAGGSSP